MVGLKYIIVTYIFLSYGGVSQKAVWLRASKLFKYNNPVLYYRSTDNNLPRNAWYADTS